MGRQFTKLNTQVEHTLTLGEWHKHREAEYQRFQAEKAEKADQDKKGKNK
jgi:hypothetical protein|tara:strand:- start:1649 stop:1798 length:150 start_codon:yes stop_codon:yes gene_type:complete